MSAPPGEFSPGSGVVFLSDAAMRLPLSLSIDLVKYILKQKRQGNKRFPVVLMLEPTHLCNLRCAGCGRIHEYKDVAADRLTVDECLGAVDECPAPIVTVTGGEPTLHPEVGAIVSGIIGKGRRVFLCTNALKLAERMDAFEPRPEFQFNVHLDGLAGTHDRITGRPGTFDVATEAIREAKRRGFRVCTNSTIYKCTPHEEVLGLLDHLKTLGVDGILLSPGFNFEDNDSDVFMTRAEIREKFARISPLMRRYPIINTPLFFEFLEGKRDLKCSPWANPTRNVRGWKAPCYMITDEHYPTFKDLMANVDWEYFEEKLDPRCRNCMTHCGFEPTVMLESQNSLRDAVRMLAWHIF